MGRRKNVTPSLKQAYRAEYVVWNNMLHRCHNPKSASYGDYGARGISVCSEWRDYETGFQKFVDDMGARPSAAHSIERTDNSGSYSSHNCIWADAVTQVRNRRAPREKVLEFGFGFSNKRSPMIQYQNEIKSLSDWAETFSIKAATLRGRLKRGASMDEAVKPVASRSGVTYCPALKQITIQ